MKIHSVTLHLIEQTLKTPFESSLETVENRECIIVEVKDNNGKVGWGEVVAFSSPWYTEETIKTCWHMLIDFIIPLILSEPVTHPRAVQERLGSIRRNNMAKAGIETAIWDLYAKNKDQSLSQLIGGEKQVIESGVVVGLDDIDKMLSTISQRIDEGYKRVKIKIKPGKDLELIRAVRSVFPTLPLIVDANSAYTLKDADLLKALDEFNLLMIEQPLDVDDIVDHATLQKHISTPICLDESIVSYEDARRAIELGSCRVINIKIGRVGGLMEAIKIHNLSKSNHIPVWCGGMLEMGISRAHNIALATLGNFTIPGDISATSNYWENDIVIPEVTVTKGVITVPTNPGIGFEVNRTRIKELTKEKQTITV